MSWKKWGKLNLKHIAGRNRSEEGEREQNHQSSCQCFTVEEVHKDYYDVVLQASPARGRYDTLHSGSFT